MDPAPTVDVTSRAENGQVLVLTNNFHRVGYITLSSSTSSPTGYTIFKCGSDFCFPTTRLPAIIPDSSDPSTNWKTWPGPAFNWANHPDGTQANLENGQFYILIRTVKYEIISKREMEKLYKTCVETHEEFAPFRPDTTALEPTTGKDDDTDSVNSMFVDSKPGRP